MANTPHRYDFIQDKKGMVWDLLLYVPTVVFLFTIALKLWYGSNQNWSYLLMFLGSFFFFVGANRILKTRLMRLPSAPIALEISKQGVCLVLRSGARVDLIKDLRFFSEIGGKTFALSGLDATGRKQQHVFHLGQFGDESSFKQAKSLLEIYR